MSSFYDLASLVMIPSGKKAGKVYSQKPLTTDGQLNFTRASTATRIGSDGKIEKTRTNLIPYSQSNFSQWSTNDSSIVIIDNTTEITSPIGDNTASKIVFSAGSKFLHAGTLSLSGIYSGYIYIKGTAGETIRFNVAGRESNYTLTGGWDKLTKDYRVAVSGSFNINTYGGATARTIYAWGAQLEQSMIGTDYIPTNGSAVSVGSVDNMPRLNYTPGSATSCPSLLLEPQRTNLLQQSEYFNTYWSLGTISITNNYATSPEGVENASRYISPGGSYPQMAGTVLGLTVGQQYTTTFYVKSDGTNQIEQSFWINAIGEVRFTPTSEWTRITHNFTATATSNTLLLFTNNGSASASSYLLYGFQMEEGSYATSYIPTFGATVTRVKESCSKTGVSSLIGSVSGTIFLEMEALALDGSERRFALSNNTTSNLVRVGFTSSFNRIIAVLYNGSNQCVLSYDGVDITQLNKIAFTYAVNDFALFVNGVKRSSDTSGVTFSANTLSAIHFNQGAGTGKEIFAEYDKVVLFTSRLTNDQLAELTSTDS